MTRVDSLELPFPVPTTPNDAEIVPRLPLSRLARNGIVIIAAVLSRAPCIYRCFLRDVRRDRDEIELAPVSSFYLLAGKQLAHALHGEYS